MTDAPTDSIDPAQAADAAAFGGLLRRLLQQCRGNLTLSQLQEFNENLPRSTVSDFLTGKRLPSARQLRAFLGQCDLQADDYDPWVEAWSILRADALRSSRTSDAEAAMPARMANRADAWPSGKWSLKVAMIRLHLAHLIAGLAFAEAMVERIRRELGDEPQDLRALGATFLVIEDWMSDLGLSYRPIRFASGLGIPYTPETLDTLYHRLDKAWDAMEEYAGLDAMEAGEVKNRKGKSTSPRNLLVKDMDSYKNASRSWSGQCRRPSTARTPPSATSWPSAST